MIAVADKYTLAIAAPSPITSDRQHAAYLDVLSHLLDKDARSEEEEKYVGLLTTLIHAYEQEHHSIPEATPIGVLRTLMESNGLRQKDLVSVFGSESIVSEVLNGSRKLNRRHIERLSKKFGISPAAFF
jgi:HTH-type transcriptional regulator / antitoxin HigA